MKIITPGRDMQSSDRRAACVRCGCVWECSVDEMKTYKAFVQLRDGETNKLVISFSVYHAAAKCPSCGRVNLVKDALLSMTYEDVLDYILKDMSHEREGDD